ncbi:hypothetical protein GGG16DRAFT_126443 [Schizophyllum commune]
MFGGSGTNPYDDLVNKATDENLTSENWEIILNLCDKVTDEGPEGARSALASLLKRLVHRNPNVQLYALSVAEALSKNCGVEVNREIASRAWTQGLEKVITDRNTHDKVRKRALSLIAQWTDEFRDDETLGIMEDCYNSLKAKNYKFETPNEPPPPAVDDEIRRREEEELQRVLEMSMQDRGGRGAWSDFTSNGDTAGSSGSGGGYSAVSHVASSPAPYSATSAYSSSISSVGAPTTTSSPATPAPGQGNGIITRVRALYSFEPTEPGELAFEKGDIIKVVDRGYKDWWRGQSKGRTGIFPVNYVEPLPEPSAAELAREAEAEAAVFAQAVNVDRLLNMLKSLDPARDNLADNEEIQELYHSCMSLRPKIVKLIDKYSQKRADLVSMNEAFVRARTIFDRMMEDSLQRNTYEPGPYSAPGASPYGPQRPDSRAAAQYAAYPPQPYAQPGYPSPAGYEGYPPPTPGAAYVPPTPGYPQGAYGPQQPAGAPAYGPQQPGPYGYPQQPPPQGYASPPGAYPQQAAAAYPGQAGPQPYPPQTDPQAHAQAPPQQSPNIPPQKQPSLGPAPYQQPQQAPAGYPEPTGSPAAAPQPYENHIPTQPYGASPYPAQAGSPQPHVQPQATLSQQSLHIQTSPQQPEPQQQQPVQQQQQPIQQQPQPVQPQPQAAVQQQPAVQQQQPQPAQQPIAQEQQPITQGPPYVYDPQAKYADPNVQAWANYYAHGGRDPAGAVYFFSVPGVTEELPNPNGPPQAGQAQAQGGDNASTLQRADSSGGASVLSAGASTVRANSIGGASMMSAATVQPSAGPELTNPHAAQPEVSAASPSAAAPAEAHHASTPSWVLPKRTPGTGLMGGAPRSASGGAEDGVHGMQGQFAAMNVGSGAA